MSESPSWARRTLNGPSDVTPCDAVYVSARAFDVPLSCAGRLVSEGRRGLRSLVITVFGEAGESALVGDHLALSLPVPREHLEAPHADELEERSREIAEAALDLAPRLEDIFRRARPRCLLFPLGVGGHADSLIAHLAAMRTFHAGGGRDVYLYEERPESLVSGSVRIRLGQLGANLPPAASRVRGDGGILRFLWQLQRVPRLREPGGSVEDRLRRFKRGAREWRLSRAWRPTKALGPRLQPLMTVPEAPLVEKVQQIVRGASGGLETRAARRLLAYSADYAKRLGSGAWAERYWLLLPDRAGTATVARDVADIVV